MALFTGHVVNKVDRKGRVSVPASFRNELAKLNFPGIVAFPSPEGLPAIHGAGIDWLENLSANFGTANPFAPKLPKSRMALFGQVERLGFDPEGRVILTRGLMEHAGISDAAEFIGLGKTNTIGMSLFGYKIDSCNFRFFAAIICIIRHFKQLSMCF